MENACALDIIAEIAKVGQEAVGITRLALTEKDKVARNKIIAKMQETGLSVRIDQAGNIIGRLEGYEPEAPAVVTGSHLDTAPGDGRYNGVLGIACALAAVRELKKQEKLKYPIEVVVFSIEEPSRFGVSAIGSKVMSGFINTVLWSKLTDQLGIALPQALKDFDLDIKNLSKAARKKEEIKAFVEIHIEQSGGSEDRNNTIGIVEKIEAPFRMKISVEGQPAYTGTLKMGERHDALISSAKIILAIQEIALSKDCQNITSTVSAIKVSPGVMNVVPGLSEMWVDINGSEYQEVLDTFQEIKDAVIEIADNEETPVTIEVLAAEKPVFMDNEISEAVERACQKLNISYRYMTTRTAHDAMNMANFVPSALLLLPCCSGVCYGMEEQLQETDILAGVQVLTDTLYQLAR